SRNGTVSDELTSLCDSSSEKDRDGKRPVPISSTTMSRNPGQTDDSHGPRQTPPRTRRTAFYHGMAPWTARSSAITPDQTRPTNQVVKFVWIEIEPCTENIAETKATTANQPALES